jgi:hypothetical protein
MTKSRAAKQRKRAALLTLKEAAPNPKNYPHLSWNDHGVLSLRKAIVLLFILNNLPEGLVENEALDLTRSEESQATSRLLSLSEEKVLTGVFTFLASTTNDPRKVTALCLEESVDHTSLTIRVSVNHGDLCSVKSGLEDVARILEAANKGTLVFWIIS